MTESTILLKLKYFAEIRDLTKKKEDIFLMSRGCKVEDVFDRLSEAYGTVFSSHVFTEDKHLKEEFTLLLNGRNIDPPYLGIEVSDGDEIVILPPVAGGTEA